MSGRPFMLGGLVIGASLALPVRHAYAVPIPDEQEQSISIIEGPADDALLLVSIDDPDPGSITVCRADLSECHTWKIRDTALRPSADAP